MQSCPQCDAPAKRYSCPHSGWPTHCSAECHAKDDKYHAIKDELKQVYMDMLDLQSKRKFPEFDFPGPPRHEWQRAELVNWRTYLSDRCVQILASETEAARRAWVTRGCCGRQFKSCIDKRIGDARTDEEHVTPCLR